MFRTVADSLPFRTTVSTVVVRNAAPNGSLVGFGFSGSVLDGTVGESSSTSGGGTKASVFPRIVVEDGFRLDEFDLDNSLNNPMRPSSLE